MANTPGNPMIRPRFLFLASLLLVPGFGCRQSTEDAARPKLVVLITIDGLRSDLLEQYDPVFTGGFRRMRDRGYRFTNAWVDHAITVSHAGHVSLATGRYPSKHGIVDAAYYSPVDGKRVLVDAVADSANPIIGMPDVPGASPNKILTEGISDWLRSQSNGSRSLAVGSGDVSSLLHVYSKGSDVYWYKNGRYVTSTYYKRAYPDWVIRFNEEVLPEHLRAMDTWDVSVPDSFRSLARPDASQYEGDLVHTGFPHLITQELAEGFRRDSTAARSTWIRWTPMIDLSTLALTKEGIRASELGTRDATDYVSIILSTVDSQTHYFGPGSLEVFDILVRLDRELESLFTFLDSYVGEDRYVVALSSDHGFPEIPEISVERGESARRVKAAEIDALFSRIGAALKRAPANESDRQRILERVAEGADMVADLYTTADLISAQTNDLFLRLYQHSYRKDRVPRLPIFSLQTSTSPIGEEGAMVRLRPGTMIDIDRTTHGSPYEYDRRVPLLFLGKLVPYGASDEYARTVDVAPTLAALAGIRVPADVDGTVLEWKNP